MRGLRRLQAKYKMKNAGMIRLCAHHGNRGHGSKPFMNGQGRSSDSGRKSYFAAHWQEFA